MYVYTVLSAMRYSMLARKMTGVHSPHHKHFAYNTPMARESELQSVPCNTPSKMHVALKFMAPLIICCRRCRDRKRKKNRDEDKLENSQVTATTGPEDNSAFEFTPKSSNTDLSRTANGYKPYPYNSPYHGQPNNGPTPYNPQAAITGFGIPPANAGPYRPADLQPYRPSQPIERPSQPIERPSQPIERPSQPIERPLQFSSLPPPGYTQDTPVRPPQTPEEFEPQQPYYVNRNAPGPQRSAPAPRGPPQSRAPNTSPPNTNPMRPYTPEQIEPQRAPPVNAAPVRSYPQDNRAFTPDDPGTSRAYTPDNRGPPQRPYTPDNRDSPRPFYPEPGHTPRSGTPDTRPTPAATPTPTSTAPLPPMARAPSQSSIPGSLARAPSQSSIPGHMARAPSQSSIPGSMARAPSQSSIPGVMARAPSKSSLGPRDPILYPYPSPPDSPASSRAESLDSSFYSNSAPRSRQDAYHTPPQTTPEGLRGPRASSMSPYVGTFSAAPAAPPDETTVW